MTQGRTLTVFLVEGTADGLLTAEIDNWIGKVIVASKTELPKLLKRSELKGLGVYVLIGNDPNITAGKQIYVGQGDIDGRLAKHNSDSAKAFWDEKTVVVVATDHSLNTAHCLHLESRLIDLANRAQVAIVNNGQNPPLPNLSESDRSKMENFLAQTLVLLPVLGIDYFSLPPVLSQPASTSSQIKTTQSSLAGLQPIAQSQSPTFTFMSSGAKAEAVIADNKFVVRQGSLVNSIEKPAIGKAMSKIRAQLRANGKLQDSMVSGKWEFSVDVPFNSPSTAAAVICGYSINGQQAWKIKGSNPPQSYAQWQQAQIQGH